MPPEGSRQPRQPSQEQLLPPAQQGHGRRPRTGRTALFPAVVPAAFLTASLTGVAPARATT
ncbi:hypothetical protein C3492_35895 [Streptomyces sp. Ru62]|nr:hypothetical protein C3492_35895 [Streptomyces sp. Ru62]